MVAEAIGTAGPPASPGRSWCAATRPTAPRAVIGACAQLGCAVLAGADQNTTVDAAIDRHPRRRLDTGALPRRGA